MKNMPAGMPAPRPTFRVRLWVEELVELDSESVGEETGESGVGLGVAEVGTTVCNLSVSTIGPMMLGFR